MNTNVGSATRLQATTALASPIFVEVERHRERLMELDQLIARRAYECFESRGRENGYAYALEDWLRAESELLRQAPVEIREADGKLTVRVEVPGFSADELELSVEPRRLLISGQKKQTAEEEMMGEKVYTERGPDKVFRALDLPVEVEPAKATGTLKDGILNLGLPKVISH